MPHFKNTNDELFWLDVGNDPAKWLPECVEITNAEAEAIRQSKIVPATYAELRAAEYPSYADQFDILYHGGFDVWKAAIEAVKLKYPKQGGV